MLFIYQMQLCGNGSITITFSVNTEASAMERGGPAKTKGINSIGFYYTFNIIVMHSFQT